MRELFLAFKRNSARMTTSHGFPVFSPTTQVIRARSGITGFHKWFSGAFPNAVRDARPGQQDLFDHVCIDMNQILHVALRKANSQEHAIRRLFKAIDRALQQCIPRQSVVFAFDGSAPLAKLLVQRSRRESVKRSSQYSLSSLHLSPGTEFMDDVACAMEYYAFLQCQKPSFRGVRFHISGASVPGEGEVKCIDWINHMFDAATDESVVIVGGDADLVLQGLALRQVKNMFVFGPGDFGKSRSTSIWEVVRTLEKLFPGQSEFVRADLMVLMILNGNDYLPKARGVAFSSCFRSYVKLKAGKHRDNFLVDGARRTFSKDFFVDLMTDIGRYRTVEDADTLDRRNRYPPAGALFKNAVHQGRLGEGVELDISPLSESGVEEADVRQWRSSAWVGGREFSWVHDVPRKKDAMHEAAALLLEELLPDVHENFVEQEAARLAEEAWLAGEEQTSDLAHDSMQGDDVNAEGHSESAMPWNSAAASWPMVQRPLFDVEEYLSGILWNLQMYIDGYAPNFYWRYSRPYGPSCLEMASWVQANAELFGRMNAPVSSAPPLPAAVSGLCMMPMTEEGRQVLPKRLQPLVEPGSALRVALEWRGPHAGLDVPAVLRVLQEQAPAELVGFTREGARRRNAWTVVFLDTASPPSDDVPPTAPGRSFPALDSKIHSRYLQHMRVQTTPATAAPRCVPWGSPTDASTWLQPLSVEDQPYKNAFTPGNSPGQGSRKRRKAQGSGESSKTRGAAWRRETGGSTIRRSGHRKKAAPSHRRGRIANGVDAFYPQTALAPVLQEARRSPPAVRHRAGAWMCRSLARPQCRLRI